MAILGWLGAGYTASVGMILVPHVRD